MNERINLIKDRLEDALAPQELKISDDSYLHVGHLGAVNGAGHYSVLIISDKFINLNRINRHKLVYDALKDLIPTQIHALSIKAQTIQESTPSGSINTLIN